MMLSVNVCQDPGVLQSIYIVKMVIKAIFILVPIFILITSVISLTKAVMDSDDKAITSSVKLFGIKIIVGAFIFFIPTLVNAFFSAVSDNGLKKNYTSCYTNATSEKIKYFKEKQKEEVQKQEVNKEQSNSHNSSTEENNQTNQKFPQNGNNKNQADNNNNNPQTSNNDSNSNINKNMYIGDSRTVGMYYALYNDAYQSTIEVTNASEYWLASVGKGYSWFNNTASNKIKSKLNYNNYNVIILMGANDLYNSSLAHKYVEIVISMANAYPNSNFIIVSVNPIDDGKSQSAGYTVKNSQVITFNHNLKSSKTIANKNVSYCDTYTSIINNFSTSDGLHYSNSTYKDIFTKINNCL